jgi:hypothetical protein
MYSYFKYIIYEYFLLNKKIRENEIQGMLC